MAKQRGPVRQAPWRNPKVYALQVTGAVIMSIGLVVVDSILLGLVGLLMIIGAFIWSKRS